MDTKGIASEIVGSSRNPLVTDRNPPAPGRGHHTVTTLKACSLGTLLTGNTMGSKDHPAPRAAEGIPVLSVMDTIIKRVIAALDKFGGGDRDRVQSKENYQGHFLPEHIL